MRIDPNQVEQTINQLREYNSGFRSKAEEIIADQAALGADWESDSSEEFARRFKTEQTNFESFATTIDEYVEGLRQILETYERMEEINKAKAAGN